MSKARLLAVSFVWLEGWHNNRKTVFNKSPDECRNVRSSKCNEGRISTCRMVDLDANPQTERIRSDRHDLLSPEDVPLARGAEGLNHHLVAANNESRKWPACKE